jgi:putative ABC transport system permease protein
MMFKSYLKIAFRNIVKHKSYSIINVMGLSVGMACFILIFSYVQNELSYDRFHEKCDRIYRLMRVERIEGKRGETPYVPAPLAPALQGGFPEVISTIRMTGGGWVPIFHKDKSFVEKRILLADPPFFDVFTFPLLQGDPETVLKEKYSVVITEDIAVKYFGDEDPIGKTMTYANRIDLRVSGVARNVPQNSDFQFDLVMPFELINEIQGFNYLDSWGAFNFRIFVFAQKDLSLTEFEKKTPEFCRKYRSDDPEDYQLLHSLFLQPMTEMHLESHIVTYIVVFSAVAVIILLLACINFMNLAVAQSSAREKEVGLRKVVGANRFQLVNQFLGESVLLSLMALPLAVIAVELVRPIYNQFLHIRLTIEYIQNWPYTSVLVGVALLVGIVSGSYPAFYASAVRPIYTLGGFLRRGSKRSFLRSMLVVFQFSVSVVLIIGTFIIHDQCRYIRTKDLGFNKEHIINVVLYDRKLSRNVENLKTELLKSPDIVSASGNYLMSGGGNNSIRWEGMKDDEQKIMRYFSVDPDFLETFEIELLEGRNFRRGSESDRKYAYLLNESAVKDLGWDAAIGKEFEIQMSGSEMGYVIGVVKDFHFQSLRHSIQPLAVRMATYFGIISIRVLPNDVPGTLDYVRKTLKKFAPGAPFEYYFLESDIDDMYRLDVTMGRIFSHFSLLAIFIACLGLLGLTSFAIVWRTKEIGIRKVLGASVSHIILLVSKDFIRLIFIANLMSWPIAYYGMHKWLQNFAYRVNIGLWTFVLSAGLALAVALFTISFQAIKAALASPVDSLKYE